MNFFEVEDESDPLSNNLLQLDNVSSFVPVNTEKYFQLDYSQFIELIRSSYTTSNIVDKDFGQNISFGMFQYYCVLLLWLRLYFILSGRGLKISETLELNNVINFILPVPKDVSLYLHGIGDLKDTTGHQYLIDVQGTLSNLNYNGAQGSYDKVTVSNLIIYETLPSLLISLLKIQADLQLDPNGVINWNLPINLRLDSALTPTRNLLGWWSAERLTSQQKAVLSNAKITNNNFNVVNIGFLPVNVLLVKSVAEQLRKLDNRAYDIMPSSRYGSVAQIAFTSRAVEDVNIDKMKSIAGKLGRTNSYIQMHKSNVGASATFRYRLKRYEEGLSDMVGYDFNLNLIPASIFQNENQIFEFGVGGELWRRSDYRISEQNGVSLINSLSKKLNSRPVNSVSARLMSNFNISYYSN